MSVEDLRILFQQGKQKICFLLAAIKPQFHAKGKSLKCLAKAARSDIVELVTDSRQPQLWQARATTADTLRLKTEDETAVARQEVTGGVTGGAKIERNKIAHYHLPVGRGSARS